ncbi:MAG: DUF262 domain-containing protein [Gemmatimonadetes bacterium]|nr:DUF262 domain-containing protein [Gemmatimonadota bacterium]
MKVSTILDHIDSGHMALPEFQRGYVWNREQVRGLFYSLYRRHPVGGLLVWATEGKDAAHRGDSSLAPGIVKLLLDGQQRMTSLYGVMRGHPPAFFDGNEQSFTGLQFHLEDETFEFYQPVKMKGDPLWVDVTKLMQAGNDGLGGFITTLSTNNEYAEQVGDYIGRLGTLLGIAEIELHIDEVTGPDKTPDVVVDIFNRVNSGGTKLSKGDLALAKICAEWPEARDTMKATLQEWKDAGYDFTLDWLLRSVNTVLTGEARFNHLYDRGVLDIQDGLKRATKHINTCLNMIAGRLGLDHDRVFFGRFAIPVMVRYLDQKQGKISAEERDKLLFWYAQAGMWGRFSGSTESAIDQDLATLAEGNLDNLLEELRLWNGGLRIEPGHFTGWSLGARFYPVLYMLTRMAEAKDWGDGLPLRENLLGKMNQLEVHHIFPKARLYKLGHRRQDVNALANYCFLTKDTNFSILDRLPEDYFAEVEDRYPSALTSQWIPDDHNLWKIENYFDFLDTRKKLLAKEANYRFAELLHGETNFLDASPAAITTPSVAADTVTIIPVPTGGIATEEEELEVEAINNWLEAQGLPHGQINFELSDETTGEQRAVLDLAWPDGLQPGLTIPVAVLLNEPNEVLSIASAAGYRCFPTKVTFRAYVNAEILGVDAEAA